MMSNPTTRIHDALTIAKVQMLNKPYIHYIDVKVMNSVSRKSLADILIRKQEIAGLPNNDMFIKMLT